MPELKGAPASFQLDIHDRVVAILALPAQGRMNPLAHLSAQKLRTNVISKSLERRAKGLDDRSRAPCLDVVIHILLWIRR